MSYISVGGWVPLAAGCRTLFLTLPLRPDKSLPPLRCLDCTEDISLAAEDIGEIALPIHPPARILQPIIIQYSEFPAGFSKIQKKV